MTCTTLPRRTHPSPTPVASKELSRVPVHTRLQAPLYGLIEALTHHAGTSRNKVVNQLLEVGLEATLAALPEDLAEDLRRRSGEVIHESLSKNGGTWERGEA